MPSNPEPPKCPANYFGKGVDYQLPDDRDAVAEYERLWREWEQSHPNDPTGEIALRAYEAKTGGVKVPLATPVQPVVETEEREEEDTTTFKAELPLSDIRILKNYASFKRKRPRDILSKLIRTHCRIY